ncbi:MAG TPA: glycosyltransferase family 2 protein [Candidatus Saccharimonadales bacterium]|nr:glycosyltransferase family 2 protein [Candidatus Saccharimonadales bacterium]
MARKKKELPIIGLIASKNPVSALESTVQSLFDGGASRVIVINDGSDDKSSKKVFKRVAKNGAEVIHLKKNVGKSNALRAGFLIIPEKCIIVQTDDDTLSGDLTKPAQLIRDGKADIVDIRVEVIRTNSLIGSVQELAYWMVNAVIKRLQDYCNARLWMSGASAMYSYEAGKVLLLEKSHTLTEDTEGLFRARAKGFRAKYYSNKDSQFYTMVPEDLSGLHKQWKRWTTGSGQVMRIYGLGGGSYRVAIVNFIFWADMIIVPIPEFLHYGLVSSAFWAFSMGLLTGMVGALRLKRYRLVLFGVFFPLFAFLWIAHALQGLYLANRMSKSGETALTWVSPKRTAFEPPTA